MHLIAVSGPKHYLRQIDSGMVARKFTRTSTYQLVEVTPDATRVSAYSWSGMLMNRFETTGPAQD